MAISGMRGKTAVRNELLDNDHVFVLREHIERNLSDVTVLNTYPPTAGWHSMVLFLEGYSSLKPVSKTEVAPISLITTNTVMCHRCAFNKGGDNSHKKHKRGKGDLKDILAVISKNTRQTELCWNENNSEEAGNAPRVGQKMLCHLPQS